MLSENLKRLRTAKGLTQEELASQLNVVRQTVSKWEKGLSVPDAEMLIELAEKLDVPVPALLGETVEVSESSDLLREISEKLSAINATLARAAEQKRKIVRGYSWAGLAVVFCCLVVQLFSAYAPLIFTDAASIGVIGGADGPTAIFVTSPISLPRFLLFALILVLSILGLCLSGRKRS